MPTIISTLTGAKLKVLPTEFLSSNQLFSMTKQQIEHWEDTLKDTLKELDTLVNASHEQNALDTLEYS